MKAINTLLISALCSLCIGCLVLLFPENISEWLVRVIGGLFLVPGLVSILVYLGRKQGSESEKLQATLPLTGMGSVVLGAFLLLHPEALKDYIVYVIAVAPAIFALNQMAYLWRIKRLRHVGWGFFVWPILVIASAVGVCLNATDNPPLALNVAAWLSLLYGLTEVFNLIYFRHDLNNAATTAVADGSSEVVGIEAEAKEDTEVSAPVESDTTDAPDTAVVSEETPITS